MGNNFVGLTSTAQEIIKTFPVKEVRNHNGVSLREWDSGSSIIREVVQVEIPDRGDVIILTTLDISGVGWKEELSLGKFFDINTGTFCAWGDWFEKLNW